MVHSNGIREPATTLLSTDLAVTSWKVIAGKLGGGDGAHQPGQRQQRRGLARWRNRLRESPLPQCLCVPSHAYIRMYVRT